MLYIYLCFLFWFLDLDQSNTAALTDGKSLGRDYLFANQWQIGLGKLFENSNFAMPKYFQPNEIPNVFVIQYIIFLVISIVNSFLCTAFKILC